LFYEIFGEKSGIFNTFKGLFGKHTHSLKIGLVGPEAQAQPGLVGPTGDPTFASFLKKKKGLGLI
jgi:hypothetical protein